MKSWYPRSATLLLILTAACSAPAGGQSTADDTSSAVLQEDFYQPVQEIWNRPTTEAPEISSDFEADHGAGQTPPAYTQRELYSEVQTPTYERRPSMGDLPIDHQLPDFIETQVAGPSAGAPPMRGDTTPPATILAETMVPTMTGPISDAYQPAYSSGRTMFFRWDALSGLVSREDSVSIGSSEGAGVYIANGILLPFTNSLNTDVFDYNTSWGNRFEFGELGENGGWMVSILDWDQEIVVNTPGGGMQFRDPFGMLLGYADGNGDEVDDDVDGDHVYGRYGEDLGTPDPNNPGMFLPIFDGEIDATAPADTDDLVTWVPIFSNLQGKTHVDISGFELMKACRRQNVRGQFGFANHWLAGVRYIDLDDRFTLNASGSFFDSTSINSSVENYIIGPQIGTEFSRRCGDFRVGGTLRCLLGINARRGEQRASYAAGGAPGGQNQPLNLNPGSFSTVDEDTAFSPVFEWRLDAAYDIGQHCAVRVGYTGFWIGGIGRAANAVEYSLPSFGLKLNDDDDLWFNAFTAGLEIYF